MKKMLFLILFLPLLCEGSFSLSEWKYFKEVAVSDQKDALVRVAIDEEIFSSSKSDLSDIRIVDGNNVEIPFKMTLGKPEIKRKSFFPKMLNNSFVPGKASSVILEMGGGGRITNQLRIETSSENFQRNATVLGSSDSLNWSILKKDAYVYDYTDKKGNFKSHNTTLDFPESTFPYIKIEIADPEEKPIQISRVEALNFVKNSGKEIERSPKISVSQDERNRQTEILFDLGSKGIPVSGIALATTEKNFNRETLVFSSSDNSNWKLAGTGYVFRYNTEKFSGENLEVSFPETNNQYFKILVKNKDNQPVGISGVRTFSTCREIVFEAKKDEGYRIFFGNQKALWPEYDLEKYFQYLDAEQACEASLSIRKDNSAYVQEKELEKPLTERFPWLMSVALSFSALVLLILALKFLKEKK